MKKENNNLYQTDEDLQDLDYEEAIIYDKRTFLRIYWSFLVDSQIILGTFFTENYLNLFIIKFSFLICTFQISFFLNAFFIQMIIYLMLIIIVEYLIFYWLTKNCLFSYSHYDYY